MKRQVAIFLLSFFWISSLFAGFGLELNTSYDSFRGMQDGSWSGNNGALVTINGSLAIFEGANLQLGGSFGIYNWNGRGNLVFANPKRVEHIEFLTAGISSYLQEWNLGLVYDCMFTKHFGIYDLNPSIDQLRFQVGRSFYSDEIGVFGTIDLKKSKMDVLGIPLTFKTIAQINVFWSHFFESCAQTTLWAGLPYRESLMFPHGKAGNFIAGFSFRVPLAQQLFLDGNGSYMAARSSHGVVQSRNYGSNICVGITYFFTNDPLRGDAPYLPVANHSNFFIDTNFNQ